MFIVKHTVQEIGRRVQIVDCFDIWQVQTIFNLEIASKLCDIY